jgi:hypothetical protein
LGLRPKTESQFQFVDHDFLADFIDPCWLNFSHLFQLFLFFYIFLLQPVQKRMGADDLRGIDGGLVVMSGAGSMPHKGCDGVARLRQRRADLCGLGAENR